METTLELNEYVDHQDDIMGELERIQSNLWLETVTIVNNGCKSAVVARIKRELENMGLNVEVAQ